MSASVYLSRAAAIAGLLGIAAASLSGCGGSGGSVGGDPSGRSTGSGFTGRSVCTANSSRGGARWTVLVYMNAANDLQSFSLLNAAQMASVGSDSSLNIVVQWKQSGYCPAVAGVSSGCGNPSFTGTRRYRIKPHSASDVSQILSGHTAVLDGDRLADPSTNAPDPNDGNVGTSDMGSYLTLQSFIQWGSTNYPADNLAVVIWDHGSGWYPTAYGRGIARPSSAKALLAGGGASQGATLRPRTITLNGRTVALQSRALSIDFNSRDEIEAWQLQLALAGAAQPIDVLAIDCSLQQMLENAYQARNSAKLMVGSEDSPPGQGYAYDTWLKSLKSGGGSNPCAAGQAVVDTFVRAYDSSNADAYFTGSYATNAALPNITQSVLDLTKMSSTASALDGFATSLIAHIGDSYLPTARTAAQAYDAGSGYGDNKDLYDYAYQILGGVTASDLRTAASKMQSALIGTDGCVLYTAHGTATTAGTDDTHSNGLAIWVPTPSVYSGYSTGYNQLALVQSGAAPHWLTFVSSQPK